MYQGGLVAKWVTFTFDLDIRWAKVRSKSRLKSKSGDFTERIAKSKT